MRLLRGFEDASACRGGCLAIGNFDGVHLGHQRILGALVAMARPRGVPAVALTFDPHPITLLAPRRVPPSLSRLERKAELIAACGVDCLIAYPTDRELLNLTPEQFFRQIVLGELHACGMVEGPNFFFGKDRTGDVTRLGELCGAAGIPLEIVEPAVVAGEIVSSSRIRRTIADGRLREALAMLGHPYRVTGTVARGASRGRTLGFPTANLTGVETLLPADGVYAARGLVDDHQSPAAVHVGSNMTFGEDARKLEVHLLDFDGGDLYGRTLSVDLLERIRDTMAFPGPNELARQLQADVERVRIICGAAGPSPGTNPPPDQP